MNKLSMNREKAMPCGGVQAPSGLRLRLRPHPCLCGNLKSHSIRTVVKCGQLSPGMRIMTPIAPEITWNCYQRISCKRPSPCGLDVDDLCVELYESNQRSKHYNRLSLS